MGEKNYKHLLHMTTLKVSIMVSIFICKAYSLQSDNNVLRDSELLVIYTSCVLQLHSVHGYTPKVLISQHCHIACHIL